MDPTTANVVTDAHASASANKLSHARPNAQSPLEDWLEYAIARFEYYSSAWAAPSIRWALNAAIQDVRLELARHRYGIVYVGDIEYHATEEYNRGFRDGVNEHAATAGDQYISGRSRRYYWTGLDDA